MDRVMEVKVGYSPVVARWVAEKGASEAADDGSLTVGYQVAGPRWVGRQGLRYGAEGEVQERGGEGVGEGRGIGNRQNDGNPTL